MESGFWEFFPCKVENIILAWRGACEMRLNIKMNIKINISTGRGPTAQMGGLGSGGPQWGQGAGRKEGSECKGKGSRGQSGEWGQGSRG